MSRIELTRYFSNEGSRNDVRMRVVECFSREQPGEGTGDSATRYVYYVEQLNDGKRVYLQKPANLHNGFDFLVCVEDVNYSSEGKRKRNYPKHEDISHDLQLKKSNNPSEYKKLYSLLQKVYEYYDISEHEMKSIHFEIGFPVDHIVKTIKWLFIEQDIRYWNYSGRNMTWNVIPEP